MENDMDSVISKIKKLFKLAESPILAEAEEATRKAHELLMKYNLDIQSVVSSVEGSAYIEEKSLERKRFFDWQLGLHGEVAKLNMCKSIISVGIAGNRTLLFFGRPHNAITAKETFLYLVNVVNRITKLLDLTRKQAASYKMGLVFGISDTIDTILAKDAEIPECTALVLSEHHNLQKALDDLGITKNRRKLNPGDPFMLEAGRNRGRQIPINKQIGGSRDDNLLMQEERA